MHDDGFGGQDDQDNHFKIMMIEIIIIMMMTVIKHCEARCRQLATTKAVQIASLHSTQTQDDHNADYDDHDAD